MTKHKDERGREYTAVEKTERYRDRVLGNVPADNPAKRREQELKNVLLETRIRLNTQKATDEREKIADAARAEIDTEHNARVSVMLEHYHGNVSRFFILGSGALFGFLVLGIAGFVCVILIGIVLALFGIGV